MRKKSSQAILLFLTILMLNSIAVWAFSFVTYAQMLLIFFVNLLPLAAFLFVVLGSTKKRESNIGFLFLIFVFCKIVYVLFFLFGYSQIVILSIPFLLNFLVVYLLFLYLSIFLGSIFLSKK